jgi:hypothetical protein
MPQVDAIRALYELLALTRGSFPHYLRHAHPYSVRGERECLAVLSDVVADQEVLANRVVEQLERRGKQAPSVEFPMTFTDSHDLSLDYLVKRAIRYQRQDLAALQRLSDSLDCHQSIRSLVDEAKGMARAHLESLQECAAK